MNDESGTREVFEFDWSRGRSPLPAKFETREKQATVNSIELFVFRHLILDLPPKQSLNTHRDDQDGGEDAEAHHAGDLRRVRPGQHRRLRDGARRGGRGGGEGVRAPGRGHLPDRQELRGARRQGRAPGGVGGEGTRHRGGVERGEHRRDREEAARVHLGRGRRPGVGIRVRQRGCRAGVLATMRTNGDRPGRLHRRRDRRDDDARGGAGMRRSARHIRGTPPSHEVRHRALARMRSIASNIRRVHVPSRSRRGDQERGGQGCIHQSRRGGSPRRRVPDARIDRRGPTSRVRRGQGVDHRGRSEGTRERRVYALESLR